MSGEKLLSDSGPAEGEQFRQLLEEEAEEKRLVQAELTVERAALGELEGSVELQKANVESAEAKLFSVEMRHEANRFRRINQTLKDKLDWYVPLEDVLGVPIIGVDLEEFIASVAGREDISGNLGDGFFKREKMASFTFQIRPEHVRRYDEAGTKHPGAEVSVFILPDRTLRPQCIRYYDRLFSYDGNNDASAGTDIMLPGNHGHRSNLFPDVTNWYAARWGIEVCRYRNRYTDQRGSGVNEKYSDRGILFDQVEYGPDYS